METDIRSPKDDCFNLSIIILLKDSSIYKTILDMMKNMTQWHEYYNLMWDILIYDWKNMDVADWLLHIEKVAVLTNSQEYELAMVKSTGASYKILQRIGNDLSWQEFKWKLEEVYSPLQCK